MPALREKKSRIIIRDNTENSERTYFIVLKKTLQKLFLTSFEFIS